MKDEYDFSDSKPNPYTKQLKKQNQTMAQKATKKPTPTFGSAEGRIKIADDFDETPEGFEPYTP